MFFFFVTAGQRVTRPYSCYTRDNPPSNPKCRWQSWCREAQMHFTQVRDIYEPTDDKKKIRMKTERTFSTQEKLLFFFVKVSGSGIWESLFWLTCVFLCDKERSAKCLSKRLRLCLEQCSKWICDISLSSSFLKNNGKDTLSRLSWFTLFL